MTRYDKRVQALAVGLSALAGYVDAVGFMQLGGFFVPFRSGNSTTLGVSLVAGATSFPWIGLGSLWFAAAIAGLFEMIARKL